MNLHSDPVWQVVRLCFCCILETSIGLDVVNCERVDVNSYQILTTKEGIHLVDFTDLVHMRLHMLTLMLTILQPQVQRLKSP